MNASFLNAKNLLAIGLALVLGITFQSCSKENEPEIVTPPENGDGDILPGVFTVGKGADGEEGTADDIKVHFSKGNLYFDGSSYCFEKNQYDIPTAYGSYESANHIGHFYWSKDPVEARSLDYYSEYDRVSKNDVFFTNDSRNPAKPNSDFIVENQQGIWRTLSGGGNGEWKYLVNDNNECGQTVRSGKYKYGVKVCGSVDCLVLLPDDWKWGEKGVGNNWQSEYSETTSVRWSTMESAGAVCIPAAGYRNGSNLDISPMYIDDNGRSGYYWSTSPDDKDHAFMICFFSGSGYMHSVDYRDLAFSVRLVIDVQ